MFLIHTDKGTSDTLDAETTRFCEEMLQKTSEVTATPVRRAFKRILEDKEVQREEFDSEELWPVSFAERWRTISEAHAGRLVRMGGELARRFYHYTNNAYRNLYRFFVPTSVAEKLGQGERELKLFIERSSGAVRQAIVSGQQAVVSRVLETDVNWTIGPLLGCFEGAEVITKREVPSCVFVLSPNRDPEYGIVKIGHDEASYLKQHPEKKARLNHRGFSWIPAVTALRHIRLHSRTLAGLYFVKKAFGEMVEVCFRRDIPDARCNIILSENVVQDAYFVQNNRRGVGLSSTFYRAWDESDALPLYNRVINRQKIRKLDSEEILNAIQESARIENELVDSEVYGISPSKLEPEILAARPEIYFEKWVGKQEKIVPTSHTIEDMLQEIDQVPARFSLETLETILTSLSKEQKQIEGRLMPTLRLLLESRF